MRDELAELEAATDRDERFDELGDVLFAAVNLARKLHVDPELALRAAADRFRGRVQARRASWPLRRAKLGRSAPPMQQLATTPAPA